MKASVRWLVLLATAWLTACSSTGTTPGTESERLNAWLDAEFAEYLDFWPMSKTRLGDKSDYDKLGDVSMAAMDRVYAWRQDSAAAMSRRFDRDLLDAEAQRSYDLWLFLAERDRMMRPYRFHRYVFGRRGAHTGLPNMLINSHKVETEQDMRDYVSRLEASGTYLRQNLEWAKTSASRGIRAPYFDYDVALSQIRRVTAGEPFGDDGTSALWTDITGKVAALRASGEVDDETATALTAAARQAIVTNMAPAYDEIEAWLATDRANVPDTASGAGALPDGDGYYAAVLNSMTTLPMTADEIHELGLSEVARIQAEMREIMATVGFEGSLQDFFTHLRTSDEFYYPNTDEGREAYLAQARSYIDAISEKLPDVFGLMPKGPLEVKRVEAFRERPGAAAHYMRGTPDGSRPGTFYVHLADMRAISKYRMENLAYHEGLPGHHMQIAIQQELTGIPRFRRFHGYTAYSEGWGLYAEYLGKDLGFYRDPYSDFGRLTGEIWRAIRLVVDTGIHAKGWSEEASVQYALENSPRPEATVRSEIRRYFNMPAQATAYKIGMIKIQELRARAERALGDNFSLAGFHDVILGSGPLPLPLLEAKVGEWIEVNTEG